MKESRYNYFKSFGSALLAVNGRSHSVILLDMVKYPELKKVSTGLPFPTDLSENLIQLFERNGFLLTDETDEFALIQAHMREQTDIEDVLNIHLNPTLDCNLSCWYCYEKHQTGSEMSSAVQSGILHYVRKALERGTFKGVHVSYFGGEPLLKFREVIRPLNEELSMLATVYGVEFSCSATTNGTLIEELRNDFMDELEKRPGVWKALQITLDGNRSAHDRIRRTKLHKEATYDRILASINELLRNTNLRIHLRINYSNESFEGADEVLNRIPEQMRSRVALILQRIWQTEGEEEPAGVEEMKRMALQLGYAPAPARFQLGKHEVCYADRSTQLLVNYDAGVYKCTARDFTKDEVLAELSADGALKPIGLRLKEREEISRITLKKCIDCNYYPVCLGPCSQLKAEQGEDAPCVVPDQERALDQMLTALVEPYLSR